VRIALVHDWLTGMRGGERVLDVIARAYPHADLYTLFYQPGATSPAIESLNIRASPLNRLPGARRHYRKLLPLYPWAASQLRVEGADLVLSISHAVAKNIKTEAGVPHLCYCLTPMRYIWDQIDAYLGRGPRRVIATPLVAALRHHDRSRSEPQQVDRFVAISNAVSHRIQQHYGRRAKVIYPPVDIERIQPDGREPSDDYLLIGGFVPYKREDLAIDAFRHRSDRLIIVGDGPTRKRLQAGAPANVEFTGRISDREVLEHLQRCRALIYPQDEDFGIAAVEAQAAGRPVIAYASGGALDTIRPLFTTQPGERLAWSDEPDPTGIHFHAQSPDVLEHALDAFEEHGHRFDPHRIRAHAARFGSARFLSELSAEIADLMETPRIPSGDSG
jgi:glycosyltransferase involved in cell wall biosynthesis